MKRPSILPAWSSPWRYDLYQALFNALCIDARACRGEGRARELYRQAQLITERTGEELSGVVWALATFEHAMHTSAAEEEEEKQPSAPLKYPSRRKAFPISHQPSIFG